MCDEKRKSPQQVAAQCTREALRLVTLDLATVLVQVEAVLQKIRQREAA